MVEEVRAGREGVGLSSHLKGLDLKELLKVWREEGARNSLKALETGQWLITKKRGELGNEVWNVYEQTFTAALDCGNIRVAQDCLVKLSDQWPGSLRVARLKGLYLEAQEKYDEALETYDNILETHPSCSAVWKRKVSIYKAQNKLQIAIEELIQLLQIFMTDFESWLELTGLYISINDYRRALFCMEELILGNPHHYLYHLKYAEICYTIGSPDKMDLARTHYSTALKLNPSSLRALFGFYMVLLGFMSKSKQGESRSKTAYQSMEWVKVQIKKMYQFDDHKLRIVEKMLDKN